MTVNSIFRELLSKAYPNDDFSTYYNFIESLSEEPGERHHILPRKEFPKLVKEPLNRIQISSANHFKAHYWLAACAPTCLSFQRALFFMANQRGYKDVTKDDLPKFAAIYEGARATHRKSVVAGWTESKRKKQGKIAAKVNVMLLDFKCGKCGREFRQVTKGVFGGHRRFCVNYSETEVSDRPFVVPSEEITKRCGKCGIEKLLDEFNVERLVRLGRANYCRECAREHRKNPMPSPLRDYTCPDCGVGFQQVKPGVFGGHRRSCVNYGARRKEFLLWDGSAQGFANKHNMPIGTVLRWKSEYESLELE